MPAHPPNYLSEHLLNSSMEQFEVDETEVVATQKRSVFARIAFVSRNTFHCINDNVVSPVRRMVDPLREGIAFIDRTYELLILKLGNPLVVKRLLYVSFVIILMNSLYYAERNDSVKGLSGGGLTDGKLFDIDLLENNLRQYIDPLVLKENIQYVSSVSRFPGSVGDLTVARYVESYFSNNGLKDVDFVEHNTFINYPSPDGTYLKFADGSFEATLIDGMDSGNQHDPQYLAFNPDGLHTSEEIDAPYVFANFGSQSDFMRLSNEGISLEGCILLVKYGGNFPEAMKLSVAHLSGAKAVVFISPPTDWTGSKNEEHISKIGVAKTRYSAGDILDSQWTKHVTSAPKQDWNSSGTTPKIPSVPISWKDGQYLIDKLGNQGIRFDDGPYSGTMESSQRLKLNVNLHEIKRQPIWNVFGSIKGREQAGKGIVFGAARDSTCSGASTSATSTAVLLELVKVFASLQRQYDWSPSRSIYFVSFDATDYNVAGSALWVNERKAELMEQGYAYIDVSDIHLGDFLSVTANPLLHPVLLEALNKVAIDPAHFGGLQNLFQLYVQQHGGQTSISSNFLENKNYVPFLNTLNIPSIDIGFRAQHPGYEPLNSCLDLFENLDKHLDGQMEHQMAITELLARVGLRLAEDPMIPYNFNHFANQVVAYRDDLQNTIDEHPTMHGLSLSDLNRGIAKLLQGAQGLEEFKQEWREFLKSSATMEPVMLANTRKFTNENVVAFNRIFVAPDETHERPGYHNFLTGTTYMAPQSIAGDREWNSFPFVRDAIMVDDPQKAVAELERLGQAMTQAAAILMTYG